MKNLDSINRLINYFTKLPGVGYKTAERYAYKIIESEQSFIDGFLDAITEVKGRVKLCTRCAAFTESSRQDSGDSEAGDECNICKSRLGEKSICVVKDVKDVIAIEKSGAFRGTYHVLHGVISPLDKKGPNDINLKSLMTRIGLEKPTEIIIATNPDVEGEATANYIASLVRSSSIDGEIVVTRLAQGLAMGTNLEYADEVTLGSAIKNRKEL